MINTSVGITINFALTSGKNSAVNAKEDRITIPTNTYIEIL